MIVDVAIIGGGFSGVVAALNLADQGSRPLDIVIVEPAAELGRGVAYGTTDPDHRLNGPSIVHFTSLADTDHFTRWHAEQGALGADPSAQMGEAVFPRRRDFGRYLNGEVSGAIADGRRGSAVVHVRDRVADLTPYPHHVELELAETGPLSARVAIIATNNGPPAVPAPLAPVVGAPGFIADPWVAGALAQLPDRGEVLIVGTGLTMADICVTTRRDRPDLPITAISRRGLLPRSLPTSGRPGLDIVEVLTSRNPAFAAQHGGLDSVRGLLRAVRDRATHEESWHGAFDDLRDAAHVLWPRLSAAEQARFVRHLGAWYEVHRFRFPPQTERVVRASLESGALTVDAARVRRAAAVGGTIEVTTRRRADGEEATGRCAAVINCTGPERTPNRAHDPLLGGLVGRGLITANPFGLGIQVDDLSRALDEGGTPQGRVRVIGPLARGRFGECMGAPHIVARFAESIPSILGVLE